MTFAAVPALRNSKSHIAEEYIQKLISCKYDSRFVSSRLKEGVTVGMSMTEKQGGSDVRANTTVAEPIEQSHQGDGNAYHLVGHKWFTSGSNFIVLR
jgi:putative acyl-CoA dehydrogenase